MTGLNYEPRFKYEDEYVKSVHNGMRHEPFGLEAKKVLLSPEEVKRYLFVRLQANYNPITERDKIRIASGFKDTPEERLKFLELHNNHNAYFKKYGFYVDTNNNIIQKELPI